CRARLAASVGCVVVLNVNAHHGGIGGRSGGAEVDVDAAAAGNVRVELRDGVVRDGGVDVADRAAGADDGDVARLEDDTGVAVLAQGVVVDEHGLGGATHRPDVDVTGFRR